MRAFARVTELNGRVQWINLNHVRQIVEQKPIKGFLASAGLRAG